MPKPRVPAYALPFVTRAFRGGRFRRYALMSALLCVATVLLGAYLAVGRGHFEQEVRVELGHEEPLWQQQRETYTLFSRYDWEHRQRLQDASRARAMRETDRQQFLDFAARGYDEGENPLGWSEVGSEIYDGYQNLFAAVHSVPLHREHHRLRERAAQALNMRLPDVQSLQGAYYDEYSSGFAWQSPDEVRRLRAILDADLVPAVEEYESPLGFGGAVRFIGGLAAMLMSLLMLVLAPLFVAVKQASEVHENTLQPLTGTSLSPSELARGLRSGPLAVIALFAVPLATAVLLSSLVVGTPLRALLFFGVIAAGTYGMASFGQLLGHVAGARRTPGIVGVALMLAMGMVWLIGTAVGFDAPHDARTLIGAVPQSSAAYVQVWALGLGRHAGPDAAALATIAFGGFAWVAFGALASKVLAHRIGGLEGPALSRTWAFGGALVAVVLACLSTTVVLRGHVSTEDRQLFYFVDLLALAIPFGMLLMARVPISEAPPKLRNLPVLPLLGELMAMAVMHMVVTSLFVGTHAFDLLSSPVALMYWLWAIAVVGLVAIRAAALPVAKVTTHMWIAFCAFCVLVAGAHVVGWTVKHGLSDADEIFAFAKLSPLLGLVQFVCVLLVPYLCVRVLKQNFASLRSE